MKSILLLNLLFVVSFAQYCNRYQLACKETSYGGMTLTLELESDSGAIYTKIAEVYELYGTKDCSGIPFFGVSQYDSILSVSESSIPEYDSLTYKIDNFQVSSKNNTELVEKKIICDKPLSDWDDFYHYNCTFKDEDITSEMYDLIGDEQTADVSIKIDKFVVRHNTTETIYNGSSEKCQFLRPNPWTWFVVGCAIVVILTIIIVLILYCAHCGCFKVKPETQGLLIDIEDQDTSKIPLSRNISSQKSLNKMDVGTIESA
ncbi:hypothetical protein WA158_005557 [Blastocystis sp. Blastoise]